MNNKKVKKLIEHLSGAGYYSLAVKLGEPLKVKGSYRLRYYDKPVKLSSQVVKHLNK